MAVSPVVTPQVAATPPATGNKTLSISPATGELLVVFGITGDGASTTFATPTGVTGSTFTLVQSDATASQAGLYCWSTTVVTGGTYTLSVVATGGNNNEMVCYRYPVGSTIGGHNAAHTGSGTNPSVSLTVTGTNSGIAVAVGDWNGVAPGSPTFTTTAGTPWASPLSQTVSTSITCFESYYADVGAAGSKTVDMTAPTGQKPTILAAEIINPGTATSTSSLFPTTVAATTGSTWTTTTNATGSGTGTTSASWAVFTNATSGGTGTIQLSGYGAQTAINGGVQPASIDSVAVTVTSNVATVARWTSATVQLFSGASGIGSATSLTLSATTSNVQTVTLTGTNCPTWAQCSDLRAQITFVHAGTTSSTANVDAVGVVVNYTVAGYVAGSAVVASQATSTANSSWNLTPSITPAIGEYLIVKTGSGSQNVTTTAMSGGSLTWTKAVAVPITASNAYADIWVSSQITSASSVTVTTTFTNASSSTIVPTGVCVERWTGVSISNSPATNTAQNTTAQSTLTNTVAGSFVTWVDADWNGVATAPTYVSPSTATGTAFQSSGNACFYYAQLATTAVASQTYGLSAPTGQKASLTAMEVLVSLSRAVSPPRLARQAVARSYNY